MGIVNCANEQYGHVHRDPFIERHLGRTWEHSVHRTTLEVLGRSGSTEGAPELVRALEAELTAVRPHLEALPARRRSEGGAAAS